MLIHDLASCRYFKARHRIGKTAAPTKPLSLNGTMGQVL